VTVTLDPQALAARGLSGGAVFQALGAANADLPAGDLVAGNRSVPVRIGHLLRSADDVAEVVVAVVQDRAIRLRDVATVEDGPAKPDQYVSFLPAGGRGEDFEPAVTIALAKREGKNAATIAHAAMERVDELRGTGSESR
jgi:multidrug efflux pump subunit AcrB